jgi:light-regulated signal transduction histidine kinase (bacteriophytochrome)
LPAIELRGQHWERIIHSHDGAVILEFESWAADSTDAQPDPYLKIREVLNRLNDTHSLEQFCERAADGLRAFTGFDRVMVYRFLDDGAGHVIAESRRDDLESFRGLHYPASDIPQQARALFYKSWLRLLPDNNCAPVPIKALPGITKPLDMSYTAVRSVSPVHMEYLRNMGVEASMSISIREGGRLWGLFACHNYSPRYVPHAQRMAAELLAHMLSLQVGGKEREEHQDYRTRLESADRHIIHSMATRDDLPQAMVLLAEGLLTAMDATGAAVYFGNEAFTTGTVPSAEVLTRLAQWMDQQPAQEEFVTRELAKPAPEIGIQTEIAAGLMAFKLTRQPGAYMMWFRGEHPHEVSWAGDPSKPYGSEQLNPRKSFRAWTEEVRGRSRPWHPVEIAAARQLRRNVLEVVVRHLERLTVLNRALEHSNLELDTFGYAASHDLKEPLRGIKYFTRFVLEDHADSIPPDGVQMLESVVRLSERMESLLHSLFHYSRVGRTEVAQGPVDMQIELDDALLALSPRLIAGDVKVRVPRRLPFVTGDAEQLREVFTNLVGNAAKYGDPVKAEHWIEISYSDPGDAPEPSGKSVWLFSVRDNGIGIDPADHERIFRLFQRLHPTTEYGGGSGAGLTIARKTIERHGGRLWVESTLGDGATFHFTLPKAPEGKESRSPNGI